MYNTSINFQTKLKQGLMPIPYISITTDRGVRILAERHLADMLTYGTLIADGTVFADGSELAGGTFYLSLGTGRLLSIGGLSDVAISSKFDAMTAETTKQTSSVAISFDNLHSSGKYYFSRVIPFEAFLTKSLKIYFGFPADPRSEHLLFREVMITEESFLDNGRIYQITAEER